MHNFWPKASSLSVVCCKNDLPCSKVNNFFNVRWKTEVQKMALSGYANIHAYSTWRHTHSNRLLSQLVGAKVNTRSKFQPTWTVTPMMRDVHCLFRREGIWLHRKPFQIMQCCVWDNGADFHAVRQVKVRKPQETGGSDLTKPPSINWHLQQAGIETAHAIDKHAW